MREDVPQLDPDFARVDARSQGSAAATQNLPLPASAFVVSINGLLGAILLQGGSTGLSFSSTPGLIVLTGAPTSIEESGGPTVLAIGAIADGEGVKRSGASLVGYTLLTAAANVAKLNQVASVAYVQAEAQARADKIDEVIDALVAAGLMLP